ncbi:unnamed protein product [Gongylonema pulchrum]|uniref:SMP-LTD domain-containing protein n=1 Tax=Gongylonema pulchrum TaxID=637853 RepID=A0A183EBH4_9BILA|nr:unnamed protein product [Gongylonema pulchrum]
MPRHLRMRSLHCLCVRENAQQEHSLLRLSLNLVLWIHNKLQLELSDLTMRSAVGRLMQHIRIRELSVGSKSPVINAVRVESFQMFEDGEGFKTLNLLADVDYSGGFQNSVDVRMLFERFAQLSIKVSY